MSKRGKLKSYAKVIGKGKDCPKCKEPMQRRKRIKPPANKTYFFTEWDYCPLCSHLQHYDEYKSSDWQEAEYVNNFFKTL